MEIGEILTFGTTVLVFLILLGLLLRQRQPQSEEMLSFTDVGTLVVQASETALELVAGAEQLWLTGRLPKDGRFRMVYNQLAEIYPDLNEDQLTTTIEAAVYWLKMASGQDPKDLPATPF
jgi:hypothetical protein